jgi:hypothetical protein
MGKKKSETGSKVEKPSRTKSAGRAPWLDGDSKTTLIDDYALKLGTFLEAMADGKVDPHELEAQEARVAELMKEIEPKLDDELHDRVTELLCELSAFSIMKTLFEILSTPPKTKFRG